MRTKEYRSLLKEGIKLGARIGAPVALGYLARNAVIRIAGGKTIDLERADQRKVCSTLEERQALECLRHADKCLRTEGLRLRVVYEGIAVTGSEVDRPQDVIGIPHHVPDFAIALPEAFPNQTPAIINRPEYFLFLEVGQSINSPHKQDQADHADRAGIHYQQLDGRDLSQLLERFRKDPLSTTLEFLEPIFR